MESSALQKLGIRSEALAHNGEEYLDLLTEGATHEWLIRSKEGLKALRASGNNPFSKLTDSAFDQFLNGIEFNERGFVHGSYEPLANELSLSEMIAAFAYFGISPVYLLDTADKYCESKGTCATSLTKTCTSNC
jgi:hypothetical protein